MIERLSIKNFKSIKDQVIECKKVNLFIGEPNTGKSNILEAVGLLSWCGYMNRELKDYIRFKDTPNIFYDELLDQKIEVAIGGKTEGAVRVTHTENGFVFNSFDPSGNSTGKRQFGNGDTNLIARMDYDGIMSEENVVPQLRFIKYYKYREYGTYPNMNAAYLMPPDGDNLFSTVVAHKELRELMKHLLEYYELQLVARKKERSFELQKKGEDFPVAYPYVTWSDTIKNIIFHTMAIASNEGSTLIFEEPESHAFPYYSKYLGKKIGLDETNQYFISTHDPYILKAVLQKTPEKDVNVLVTYFEDLQTKMRSLDDEQISELLEFDPFLNLKGFITDGTEEMEDADDTG